MLGFEGSMYCTEGAVLQHQAITDSLQSFHLPKLLRRYLHELLLPVVYRNGASASLFLWHKCLMEANSSSIPGSGW